MKELIYGPVHSLRFGRTLGINLLGEEKVCSFNCPYCHLGLTEMTLNFARKEYVFPKPEKIVDAFRTALKGDLSQIQGFVISGNGEPTLHPELDEIIPALMEIKNVFAAKIPMLILSNGAHLDTRKVINALNHLDDRIIKLDAGNESVLKTVNAPLVRINMSKLISGIGKLKDVVIQSLFIKANSSPEFIDEWIEVLGMIKPKSVQIMTAHRPAPGGEAEPVDEDTLYSIAFRLKKKIQLEARVYAAPK